jgi:hypothetical protein
MPTPDNQALMPPILNVESDSNVHTKQGAEHRSLSLTRPLAFFDLETTGTIVGIDRIVELAVIKLWPRSKKPRKDARSGGRLSLQRDLLSRIWISDLMTCIEIDMKLDFLVD